MSELDTERLRLRRWREGDREPFAALNADPVVMEHFPALTQPGRVGRDGRPHRGALRPAWVRPLGGRGSWRGAVRRLRRPLDADVRSALHACASRSAGASPAAHWGHGYATEAARAAVDYGFVAHELEEIVAFTVPANFRSRRVMERLGMTHDPADDFDHPGIPAGDPLRRHVLYRLAGSREGGSPPAA